jgi:hypothetical protein
MESKPTTKLNDVDARSKEAGADGAGFGSAIGVENAA